jgi:AmmeMemoRadiSam system protein B
MASTQNVRNASHAGSWYTDNEDALRKQLDKFLEKANVTDMEARAVISPHAGYSYSGPSAAYAYKNLNKSKIKRIFILGPSHHVYLTNCALSMMDVYETPVGNIPLDKKAIKELSSAGEFEWMKKSVDEDEHSIEMQLPFIAKMMEGANYAVVPVLVGSLNKEREDYYGQIFSKYLEDPENFFVISSDFCHWGKRFNYTVQFEHVTPIHKSIELLDKQGMEAIEKLDTEDWYTYLKKYKNTICGRHPIGVLLQAMKHLGSKHSLKFVHYAQSSQCTTLSDSSVSYAVAVVSKQH